jgi:outer membrane protein assembly factor BamD (BamD/ComL family)
MNKLIYCDSIGMIEVDEYKSALEAILNAQIIIREYNKSEYVDLVGLRIEFADGTVAVKNKVQTSDCLLVSAPPAIVETPTKSNC